MVREHWMFGNEMKWNGIENDFFSDHEFALTQRMFITKSGSVSNRSSEWYCSYFYDFMGVCLQWFRKKWTMK